MQEINTSASKRGTTSYLISNWTMHARSCHKQLFKNDQQKSLGMYLNTLSQSKSIDGSALVSVVNCDGHENTETHTAGPTERTSVNGRVGGVQTGSRNIPEHVYEEQSLHMHESQYNKKTHEDISGIGEEKGRLPKNSPVIQPFIYQSECAQVISCALMSNQRLQDIGDVPSCRKGHQLVSQHSPYTPKENCNNEIEGNRNESLSIKHRSSIAVREDNCTRVSKCLRDSQKSCSRGWVKELRRIMKPIA